MGFTKLVSVAISETRFGDVLRYLGAEAVFLPHALARLNADVHLGVFSSLDAAKATIPRGRQVGWENEDAGKIWLKRELPDQPAGYPLYFLLHTLLRPGDALVDWGGSIGITYFNYKKRTALPDGLNWTVVEVPHVAAQGANYAQAMKANNLHFESALAAVERADILISAGAVQYMDCSVPGLFDLLRPKPKHIIFNKLPLTREREYWTLQNLGFSVTPYRVFNEDNFIAYFTTNGYRLRERWTISEIPLRIPFHSQCYLPVKAGLYFERIA